MIHRVGSLLSHIKVLGGLYLGWGIGANDSANIFGTAVATRIVPYRLATILIAIFVFLGSIIQGPGQFLHIDFSGGPGDTTGTAALIATVAAAITVTIITYLAIPSSTSQAAIGGMMGIAIASAGLSGVHWNKFLSMLFCWLINPIMSAIMAIILLKVLGWLINRFVKSAVGRDRVCKIGLLVFGCYGAYALGANNVVVTTSVYFHAGYFGDVGIGASPAAILKAARIAAGLGGAAIAIGALTYSRKVMTTIGSKVTPLYPFSALVVVLTAGVALDFFTQFNIPVSSSQAIVGALIGVSLHDRGGIGNIRELLKIFSGWLLTPFAACIAAMGAAWLAHVLFHN
jgi:inorganic phosphate transporter, PiT family